LTVFKSPTYGELTQRRLTLAGRAQLGLPSAADTGRPAPLTEANPDCDVAAIEEKRGRHLQSVREDTVPQIADARASPGRL
jgi:hypothetical protein